MSRRSCEREQIVFLRQAGSALAMYSQDYDEHLANCCAWGCAWSWGAFSWEGYFE
jgi:hypothetical protein